MTRTHDARQGTLDMDDIFFPVVERPLKFTAADGKQYDVPGHKALVRSHPNNRNIPVVLSIVGEDFQLVTNRELFTGFEEQLYRLFPSDKVHVRSQRTALGARVRRTYRCDVTQRQSAKLGDVIAFELYASNAYGGGSLRYGWMTEVLACTNLAVLAADKEAIVRRHTGGIVIENIANDVHRFSASFGEAYNRMETWGDIDVTPAKAGDLLEHFPGGSERFREFIVNHCMCGVDTVNFWKLFNVITAWSSHNALQPVRRTAEDNVNGVLWNRQERVRQWINNPEVKKLLAA